MCKRQAERSLKRAIEARRAEGILPDESKGTTIFDAIFRSDRLGERGEFKRRIGIRLNDSAVRLLAKGDIAKFDSVRNGRYEDVINELTILIGEMKNV